MSQSQALSTPVINSTPSRIPLASCLIPTRIQSLAIPNVLDTSTVTKTSKLPINSSRLPRRSPTKHASGHQILARIRSLQGKKEEQKLQMKSSPSKIQDSVSPGKRRREDFESEERDDLDDWSNCSLEFGAIGRSPSPLKKRSRPPPFSSDIGGNTTPSKLQLALPYSGEGEKMIAAHLFSTCRSPPDPSFLDITGKDDLDELDCIPVSPQKDQKRLSPMRSKQMEGSQGISSKKISLIPLQNPEALGCTSLNKISVVSNTQFSNPTKSSFLQPPSPSKLRTLAFTLPTENVLRDTSRRNKATQLNISNQGGTSLRRSQRRPVPRPHVVKPTLTQSTLSFRTQGSKLSLSKMRRAPKSASQKEGLVGTSSGLNRITVDRLDSLDSLLSKLGSSHGFSTMDPLNMKRESHFSKNLAPDFTPDTKIKDTFVDFDVTIREEDDNSGLIRRASETAIPSTQKGWENSISVSRKSLSKSLSVGSLDPDMTLSNALEMGFGSTLFNGNGSKLTPLQGIIAFVDVRTSAGDPAGTMFADLLRNLGARVNTRFTSSVTHIIFKCATPATIKKYKSLPPPKPFVVGIGWILKCAEVKGRVGEEDYLVEIGKEEGLNRGKSSIMGRKSYESRILVGQELEWKVKNESDRLERERRKSLQFIPNKSSPLAKSKLCKSKNAGRDLEKTDRAANVEHDTSGLSSLSSDEEDVS